MRYDATAYDRFDQFYREDSVERLAETGAFLGKDAILEYMLGGSDAGPFYTSPPEVDNIQFTLQNYDRGTEICTFMGLTSITQTSNPENTAGELTYRSATMVKMQMDLAKGYFTVQDFYFGRGFWDVALRTMQDSDNTRAYICSVMGNECADLLPAVDNCTERLEALPYVTSSPVDDTVFSYQTNSLGCRGLHAAFAQVNPEQHCAHISFEPMADPDGKIKCQDGYAGEIFKHSDLFTEQDLAGFEQYMAENGFDPSSGIELIE